MIEWVFGILSLTIFNRAVYVIPSCIQILWDIISPAPNLPISFIFLTSNVAMDYFMT